MRSTRQYRRCVMCARRGRWRRSWAWRRLRCGLLRRLDNTVLRGVGMVMRKRGAQGAPLGVHPLRNDMSPRLVIVVTSCAQVGPLLFQFFQRLGPLLAACLDAHAAVQGPMRELVEKDKPTVVQIHFVEGLLGVHVLRAIFEIAAVSHLPQKVRCCDHLLDGQPPIVVGIELHEPLPQLKVVLHINQEEPELVGVNVVVAPLVDRRRYVARRVEGSVHHGFGDHWTKKFVEAGIHLGQGK
mmetsp:Transcript_12834/g.34459  ORF Transcript_12834/g.34459 Transcript_12834/m.34459 type:complete len:240 (-) Transcript_12834:405-1124(-)